MAARCLKLIKSDGPIVAISLADKLGIVSDREGKRRIIRKIVQHLRNAAGEMIIADTINGYFLTDDPTIWKSYLAGRQIEAKTVLGKTHKQLKMVTDTKGQGLLFVPGQGSLNNKQFARSA